MLVLSMFQFIMFQLQCILYLANGHVCCNGLFGRLQLSLLVFKHFNCFVQAVPFVVLQNTMQMNRFFAELLGEIVQIQVHRGFCNRD